MYEIQTTPFGLCNAETTFQRLVQTALIGLFLKHCIINLDDVLAFGGDIREHNTGLTLNPKNCHFLQFPVTFIGNTVSSNGMVVTEDRKKRGRTWPTPTNQMELRGFFGLAAYYRRFV